MRISYFFKLSWLAQLLVGIALFLCSFFLEYQILKAFISPPLVALVLTITLETGKVTAIIWHYYLNHLAPQTYPESVRMISNLFRIGLLTLSLLCSQLFLTAQLDRPNLKEVRNAELAALEQHLGRESAEQGQREQQRKKELAATHASELAEIEEFYSPRLEQLETLLLQEMNHTVNGVFKGRRYEEIEQRLEREKTAQRTAVTSTRQRQARETSQLEGEFNELRQQTAQHAEQDHQRILAHDYAESEQVHDPRIVAFLKVIKSLVHVTIQPLQFVCLFSLLLSVLMEAGIMLAFAVITVSMAPVLAVQHEETVEGETLNARVRGESAREEVRHEAALTRIMNAGKRTIRKAQDLGPAGLGNDQ